MPSLAVAVLASFVAGLPPTGAPPAASDPPSATVTASAPATYADAEAIERETIERLRHGESWVRRAFAAERLGRFDCLGSEDLLRELLRDDAWQVRCYAILACARRRIELPTAAFTRETEPRVIRTALRCRYRFPPDLLTAGVERLNRSARLEDKLLALELALAGGLPDTALDRDATLTTIVNRMDRVEAGALSPRLAAITSGRDSGRNYRWREWLRKHRKDPGLHGGFLVPSGSGGPPLDRGVIALMPGPRFVDLERHMQDLADRRIDLAILLDCTASMSGELAECQGGIDALMLFAQGVAREFRVAIVGYRDERDDFETKGWDFSASIAESRERLWSLSAEGGGDTPESVLAALKLGYERLSWRVEPIDRGPGGPPRSRVGALVLVGDAPPHPGTGDRCVDLARTGLERGITAYAIAAHTPGKDPKPLPGEADAPPEPPAPAPDDRVGPAPWTPSRREPKSPWRRKLAEGEVAYFAEIAQAGGGRAVRLDREASLVAEIAGLTLGDRFEEEFEEFFASWMALCR